MKQKKYFFTLMEVMIAFAIISMVLGMIFSSLYQETILKKKLEEMEKTVMAHIMMQQFLDRVFANHISTDPQIQKSALYTIDGPMPKLSILFNNGIDPDPLFCGELKGLLYVEDRVLVFKIHEEKPFERTAVLRENVDHLSFEFLTNATHGVESSSTWDEKANFSPSFIKITLNQTEDYVFWINQSSDGIPLKAKQKERS